MCKRGTRRLFTYLLDILLAPSKVSGDPLQLTLDALFLLFPSRFLLLKRIHQVGNKIYIQLDTKVLARRKSLTFSIFAIVSCNLFVVLPISVMNLMAL